MHNNLNILIMKQVLELQPFILNANRVNKYLTVKQFKVDRTFGLIRNPLAK